MAVAVAVAVAVHMKQQAGLPRAAGAVGGGGRAVVVVGLWVVGLVALHAAMLGEVVLLLLLRRAARHKLRQRVSKGVLEHGGLRACS